MLSKIQKLREEREQGFTLIELLVVILIIGILAAIAIPAFLNQRKSAVDSSAESDAKNVATAIETATMSLKGQPGVVTYDSATKKISIQGKTNVSEPISLSNGSVLTIVDASVNDANGYEFSITNPGGTSDRSASAKGIVYKSMGGLG